MTVLMNKACYGLDESQLCDVEDGHRIHSQLRQDWLAMQQAAKQDGIALRLVSGYRSFSRQAAIWNGKFSGQRPVLDDADQVVDLEPLTELEKIAAIQRFSAMPGSSRHHWGSDIDIYDPSRQTEPLQLTPKEYLHGGPQWQTAQWLAAHAAEFGFFQPYAKDLGGVSVEPWHLSHRATSQTYAQQWQLTFWCQLLEQQQVQGWQTICQYAESLIARFMNRINHE